MIVTRNAPPPFPVAQADAEVDLEVQFDLDANGVLHVDVTETSTGTKERLVITNDKVFRFVRNRGKLLVWPRVCSMACLSLHLRAHRGGSARTTSNAW
jgi:hypothetical protein